MTDQARELVINIEQALNIEAVLGGVADAGIARYHGRFYFAAIPRDMLRGIIACLQDSTDSTVNVGGGYHIVVEYTVCGVLHRFDSGPTRVSGTLTSHCESYHKYGLHHRIGGPAITDIRSDVSRTIRRWMIRGVPKRGDGLPEQIINYSGPTSYAAMSWYAGDIITQSIVVQPGDELWDEVAFADVPV